MSNSVQEFYDAMADDYHLIFRNWQESVREQAIVLDTIIRKDMGPLQHTLLDCACGIGTQAVGLAALGYTVHATDLSPVAVKRVAEEAKRAEVSITTGVADFRTLDKQVRGRYDVLIACDNALPHLLGDNELARAVNNFWEKLVPGGLLLLSIRDYDKLILETPKMTDNQIFDTVGGRRVVFQVWDWAKDRRTYTVNQFLVKDGAEGNWEMKNWSATYRALRRGELLGFLSAAGFTQIRWLMPEESGYYQPIVVARKIERNFDEIEIDNET